jgi:D-methionine transport system ATP-binding protein
MINLENLTKRYTASGKSFTALSNINLQIQQGEIFGVIGKSGAGKSTLIRCINLLEQPSEGRVLVAGEDLTQLSPSKLRFARRKIGMIFQHFNLLSTRTVYENIAFPLELANLSRKEILNTITPLLELTGLTDKKEAYPSQLSGGQKQRVAIARALASKPHVLLSDEATSALDPETTLMILDLLKDIRDQLNLTILLITHEMSVIKACCDKVAILQQGQLIEENNVGEFFIHPKTETAKNFIASALAKSLPPPISAHILKTEQPFTHPVWRLSFLEKSVTQPIITHLINLFNLRVNILQANVEYIQKYAMGIMIIAVNGSKENLQKGMHHLETIGIKIEVIGYVPNDIIPFA